MRTTICIFLVVFTSASLINCSPGPILDGTAKLPPFETLCFTFLDRQTGEPLEGVGMYATYTYLDSSNNKIGAEFSGISDSDGELCGEIRVNANPGAIYYSKEKYLRICEYSLGVFPTGNIFMDHEAYLRFKIVNIDPASENDRVKVWYESVHFNCLNALTEIVIRGQSVDTIVIKPANSYSPSRVVIESFGANPFSDTLEVNVESRETTHVDVRY